MQDTEQEWDGSLDGRGVSPQANYPIRYVAPGALKQPKRNVRRHPPEQLAAISRSIEQYGFMMPVLIDRDATIVCGVARVEAAKQAGLREIPAIEVTHLSKAQIRAYRLADNKLAETATWDLEELKLEFEEIVLLEPGFDLTDTGFHTAELDIILDGDTQSDAADLDGIAPDQEAVTRVGDLWLIGKHKLLCGDAKADAAYARLLSRRQIVPGSTAAPSTRLAKPSAGNTKKPEAARPKKLLTTAQKLKAALDASAEKKDSISARAGRKTAALIAPASATSTTKAATVMAMLRSADGATLEAMQRATGWQAHSVRGFLSGNVRKKQGQILISELGDDAVRRYRIDTVIAASV